MSRQFITRILLQVYPPRWRNEYGHELAVAVARRPLTVGVIWNVLSHGVLQRFRVTPVWAIAGAVLALKLISGTTANSISPLATNAYRWFFISDSAIALTVGYFTVIRDRKSIRAAMGSAALAATVGMVPEVILALLWAVHAIHPTILDMDGTAYIAGKGIVDLCARGQINGPADLLFGLMLCMPVGALVSSIEGFLGGAIAKAAMHRQQKATTS